jgi:AcrR family transcriptional regulator
VSQKKRGDNVSLKGEKTKQDIREKAYQLFVEKGFKEVTMKDICELTGLSRGGLYRHYESTSQIFLEIVNDFSNSQKSEIFTKIEQHIPATTILEEILSKYANEMLDYKNSISLAVYEFYSNPMVSKEDNSVKKQYEISKSTWVELINYGIDTKEFNPVTPESIFNIIIFAYQGVRMYSRLMKMDNNIPTQIINEIKRLLLPEEVQHEK